MELIKMFRVVELYNKSDQFLFKDYNVDNIPSGVLIQLIKINKGDEGLYDAYELNLHQVEEINKYLEEKISINFKLYDYILDYRGLYRYSDGTIDEE